jgi:hypothetical protein
MFIRISYTTRRSINIKQRPLISVFTRLFVLVYYFFITRIIRSGFIICSGTPCTFDAAIRFSLFLPLSCSFCLIRSIPHVDGAEGKTTFQLTCCYYYFNYNWWSSVRMVRRAGRRECVISLAALVKRSSVLIIHAHDA